MSLPERILVEAIDWPVDDTLQLLAACGLGEAQLLLRTPSELSDGQRYRFRLAFALSLRPRWIVADEFTATLDRTLARVVAFNVRRLADRSGTGFLLATTHEDVTCDLAPDLHIQCSLNGQATVTSSGSAQVPPVSDVPCARPLKKKASVVRKSSGSVPQPSPTGRTSLGGITGATRSA